jgi:hypothetical protein
MPNELIHCLDLQFLTQLEPHVWKLPMVNKECNSLCSVVLAPIVHYTTAIATQLGLTVGCNCKDYYRLQLQQYVVYYTTAVAVGVVYYAFLYFSI